MNFFKLIMNFLQTSCELFKLIMNLKQTSNRTAHFKNINNCLNTNIHSYLETSGGQSSNPYLNVVYFFNTRVD
jgi:hypothetical protein